MKLENVELQDLWIIQSILSTQDKTTIVAGVDNSEAIDARVIELQNQREITDSNYNKDKLAERIAKLTGWVAMIKVWAASEVEMREKKLRIEDALNATRAAVSEWVVAGWWTALLKASESLSGVDLGNADQNIGLEIVRKALSYPVRQIAENAWKEGSVVINSILENTNINYWYDAAGDKYVDMIELGIIDPKKVERVALEEAVSLAWMFLTTESAIVKVKKDSIELPQMPQMPNMWGMWGMPMM
jgi:chaperonin GroEL